MNGYLGENWAPLLLFLQQHSKAAEVATGSTPGLMVLLPTIATITSEEEATIEIKSTAEEEMQGVVNE